MKKFKLKLCITILLFFVAQPVFAVPTFQVYSEGAAGGSYGPDQDTWFTSSNPVRILVAGAFKPNDTISLMNVTMLLSVPDGEYGTITITGLSGAADPFRLSVADPSDLFNPNANANADILTNVGGLDGYSDKSFAPPGSNFNNHYPLQSDVSDFLLFDIGEFSEIDYIRNYDPETNTVSEPTNWLGQLKEFELSFSGFTQIHIDVYGLEKDLAGKKNIKTSWEQNPGSHDTTITIPAPGAIFLGGIGVGFVGWLKRRRAL